MPPGPSGPTDYKRVFSGESRPSLFEIAGVPSAVPVAAAGPGGGGRYPLSDYRPQMAEGGRILHSVGHPAGLLTSRKYRDDKKVCHRPRGRVHAT